MKYYVRAQVFNEKDEMVFQVRMCQNDHHVKTSDLDSPQMAIVFSVAGGHEDELQEKEVQA